jgi:hypothetical protein
MCTGFLKMSDLKICPDNISENCHSAIHQLCGLKQVDSYLCASGKIESKVLAWSNLGCS